MKKLLALAFLLLPLLLLAGILLKPDGEVSTLENRTLLTRKDLRLSLRGNAFQEDTETYLSDQFPLRAFFKAREAELFLALGAGEFDDLYVGKDKRLFERYPAFDEGFLRKEGAKIKRLASEGGVPVTALPVPPAEIPLRKLLPEGAPVYDHAALMKLFREAAGEAKVLDLAPALTDPGDYYRTDHHWTTDGAYKAYLLWMASREGAFYKISGEEEADALPEPEAETVSRDFRGTLFSRAPGRNVPPDEIRLPPIPEGVRAEADGKEIPFYDLSALEGSDKYAVFQGGNHGFLRVDNPEGGEGVLLVLRDSFANSLLPFLIREYRTVILIDERYALLDPLEAVRTYGVTEVLWVKKCVP